jgi:3-hydroxyisobutyrate dehydrogenase-like beta-hydroxyacid dehydrogenase
VVVCVSDYDSVREILTPYSDILPGRVLVNLSSGTPEQAREMSEWVSSRGAEYLDGAAMSGTRLVGRPEAVFLYSGSPSTFTAHQSLLKSLGGATYLGEDSGLASLYDTALYGMNWGVLSGFFHAVSLVGNEVDARTFAAVATAYLPFVTSLMTDYAQQIEGGHYPSGEGTLEIHAGAIDHLIHTSYVNGISADVPSLFKTLIERGIAAGHGSNGIASIHEVIKTQKVIE